MSCRLNACGETNKTHSVRLCSDYPNRKIRSCRCMYSSSSSLLSVRVIYAVQHYSRASDSKTVNCKGCRRTSPTKHNANPQACSPSPMNRKSNYAPEALNSSNCHCPGLGGCWCFLSAAALDNAFSSTQLNIKPKCSNLKQQLTLKGLGDSAKAPSLLLLAPVRRITTHAKHSKRFPETLSPMELMMFRGLGFYGLGIANKLSS